MTAVSLRGVLAVRVATLLAIWVAWELLARSGLVYEGIVPSSLTVVGSIVRQLSERTIYVDAIQTTYEVVAGFAVGSAAGASLGLLLGARRHAGAYEQNQGKK